MCLLSLTRLAAVAASVAGLPSVTMADWSAADDFSTTSNPSGPWSYGTRNSAAGTSLWLLPSPSIFLSMEGWQDPDYSSQGNPLILKNFSKNPAFTPPSLTAPPQALVMHPAPPGFGPSGAREFVVTRWTAPTTGNFDISGGFFACDLGTTDVHVVVNGVSIFSAVRNSWGNATFALSGVSVTAGDTVDFVVGNYGSYYYDSTQLDATIRSSAPPCPADLDGDGTVSGADLAVMLGGWGSAGSTDVDGSGATDGADLAILLDAWGQCP